MSDNKVKDILENATQNGKKENIAEIVAFTLAIYGAEEAARGLFKLGKKGFNKLFPKQEEVVEKPETEEVAEATEEK